MDDARLAIFWAISDWLVSYAGWTGRELRRIGFHLHGIPFSNKLWFPPEWLTGAFRQRVSRELGRLEAEGLITRVSTGTGGRTTHVRPTALLMDVLVELAAERDEATAIRKSLGMAVWGQAVLAELDGAKG